MEKPQLIYGETPGQPPIQIFGFIRFAIRAILWFDNYKRTHNRPDLPDVVIFHSFEDYYTF